MNSILTSAYIDETWKGFLTRDRLEMLGKIEQNLQGDITPDKKNILRFMNINLTEIKVVILGQDPYPQKGVATGRAFEVGGLLSWQQRFRQVSLKNILRLIHKNYNRIIRYEDIFSFTQIKQEIKTGAFPVLSPDQLFLSWEKQGVLLLNTSFTCSPGSPGSHELIWKNFANELLMYISSYADMHWFLWGKHAWGKQPFITKGTLHISRHPMLCSQRYTDDFLKSDCFLKTAHLIKWIGK